MISLFLRSFVRFYNKLTSCTFNSDYRLEQSIIDSVYGKYIDRITADSSSKYLWRSVCQYRCQSFARKPLMVLVTNICAFILLPFILFYLRPNKQQNKAIINCKYLKIDFHMAYQVPETIKNATFEKSIPAKYLTIKDLYSAFYIFIKCRAIYPELLLKYLLWIASVRPYLDSYNIEYLIQYCEYSAYSSLRKLFLNSHGVLLANITHGEEFISCRSAFSSFDQYFAWDLTPQSIHDSMHIEYSERFTFNPCSSLDSAPTCHEKPTLGFLWPSLEGPDLALLVEQLNYISNYGIVIVRPHPSRKYSNDFDRHRYALNAQISDPNKEDIHSFIDSCDLLIGYLSAALLQAAFRGREVVYLHNAYLASLMQYHTYYQKVNYVDIKCMGSFVTSKWNIVRSEN